MQGTITQFINGMGSGSDRNAMMKVLTPIGDRLSCSVLASAGLVITGAGGTTAKLGATAFYAIAQGIPVTKAAATVMPALAGNVANAAFNVYSFFITRAGVVTSAMGSPGATLALVKFPPIPVGSAVVGHILINPTGTGGFVGGTTALDDATVVPNAVYLSPTGSADSTILV